MNRQNVPPEIWLDARVASTIPNEPKPEFDENQVRYFSADRVRELVAMAKGGPEFFIQITTPAETAAIFGLTNYGRIYQRRHGGGPGGDWKEIEGPDLGGDHAKMES